jgi:hypothetical protein
LVAKKTHDSINRLILKTEGAKDKHFGLGIELNEGTQTLLDDLALVKFNLGRRNNLWHIKSLDRVAGDVDRL